ncbi:hypothetical protein [Yeosuana marina]|uniref:hypothetical protein n=1 Tax=Yeosuana marina TaxID=1565536 RepID=UPI00141F7430|nr:hypothetical protein [Yeosuana marina]
MRVKILLILLIIFSKFSYSQEGSTSNTESYILTKKGEKIRIFPNERITYNRFKIDYYSFKNSKKKLKSINPKEIVKIVDENTLYLPCETESGKHRIYRVIAKNRNYILGDYDVEYTTSSALDINKSYSYGNTWYVILDKKNNIVERGELYGKVFKLKDIRENHVREHNQESVNTIIKYFGNCIDKDSLFVSFKVDSFRDFLNNKEPTAEKEEEWIKLTKGRIPMYWELFLPDVNQLECK